MKWVLILAVIFVGMPVLGYMLGKFTTAGVLRAKRRDQQKQQTKEQNNE